MGDDGLKTVTCAYRSAIYSGKWSSDAHAVTVRYRGRQVTTSHFVSQGNVGFARQLLREMIENDPHLQGPDAR